MPASWMNGPTTVTNGQPVSPWVPVGHLLDPTVALYNAAGAIAHLILEGAYVVAAGVAESSEILYPNTDISAAPGSNISITLHGNRFPFLRLSASSDGSASVYGGIN